MSLDLKYRPTDLNEIVGNEEAIESINKLITQKEHPHTFLLHGAHGCGKTTLARILAKKFNCVQINEINTANDRGIDTARNIIDDMKFKTLDGGKKAYIVDECHKLNDFFQSAMLKSLEEPPEYIYFFFCTTNPEKLLSTVKSRCTKIKINTVKKRPLVKHLQNIAKLENKNVEFELLTAIADVTDGHVRDSLILLNSIFDLSSSNAMQIIKDYNLEENEQIINLCRCLLNGSWKRTKSILKNINEEPEKIRWAILGYMSTVILSDDVQKNERAALIIEQFKNNFFDNKKAGLYLACMQVFY